MVALCLAAHDKWPKVVLSFFFVIDGISFDSIIKAYFIWHILMLSTHSYRNEIFTDSGCFPLSSELCSVEEKNGAIVPFEIKQSFN